jgi:hypothetical protein
LTDGPVDGILDVLLVGVREPGRDLVVLDGVAYVVGVVLERVLGVHLLLVLLVLALYFSASCTIFSISSLLSHPLSLVIAILFFFPVVFSSADTFRMPFASRSKQTVI